MTTKDISGVLRQAIKNSDVPLLILERETGVQRASIRRFIDNKQSLRLDVAAKLAAYFGLELVKKRKAK